MFKHEVWMPRTRARLRDDRPDLAKPERIATVLERDIRSGVLGFGDRLQSETALMERFAASRNTVRKGLELLARSGLIRTRSGIGSFVTFEGRVIDDALGWSRALAAVGAEVETRLLRLEATTDAELAARLGIGDPAFLAIDRVRTLASGGRPISIERSRVPLSPALEHIPLRGLRGGSLSETLRTAGLVPHHGEEWADIAVLDDADADILKCAAGTAFLRTRRLTQAPDDHPIEYVTSLLHPSIFALHLTF